MEEVKRLIEKVTVYNAATDRDEADPDKLLGLKKEAIYWRERITSNNTSMLEAAAHFIAATANGDLGKARTWFRLMEEMGEFSLAAVARYNSHKEVITAAEPLVKEELE